MLCVLVAVILVPVRVKKPVAAIKLFLFVLSTLISPLLKHFIILLSLKLLCLPTILLLSPSSSFAAVCIASILASKLYIAFVSKVYIAPFMLVPLLLTVSVIGSVSVVCPIAVKLLSCKAPAIKSVSSKLPLPITVSLFTVAIAPIPLTLALLTKFSILWLEPFIMLFCDCLATSLVLPAIIVLLISSFTILLPPKIVTFSFVTSPK